MKKSAIHISFLMLVLMGWFPVSAQTIAISWVEIAGSKIIVHYDLESANPNHEFSINLFSSKDNFSSPLTKVTGDVGNEIKPGKDRKIVWDVIAELGNYRGDLELEVRGKLYTPFMKLSGFDTSKKYKRGKTYPLVWTSGNMGGQIDVELYDGQSRVYSERGVPNTGKLEWVIPGNVKPGSDYRLKFTDTRNREDVIFTKPFSIVPRTPTPIKLVAGLAAAGGIAAVLALSGGEKKAPSNDLPGPPPIPD